MTTTALSAKATDYRSPLLTRTELDSLWTEANEAMHDGEFARSYATIEGLCCQANRGNPCADLLPMPALTKLGDVTRAAYGEKAKEVLQGLSDRVESINHHATRLRRA